MPDGPRESLDSRDPGVTVSVTGDLGRLVVPLTGWPVAAGGMGGSLTGCPAAMACVLRRPGRVSVISQAAGPVGDDCPAPVGWICGAGSALQGGVGSGGLRQVVVASREAAHLAKVEWQIADQVAALRTIAGGGAPRVRRGQEGGE